MAKASPSKSKTPVTRSPRGAKAAKTTTPKATKTVKKAPAKPKRAKAVTARAKSAKSATAKKTAAKPKTPTKPKTAAKPKKQAKPVTKAPASLQARIDAIDTRLKRANTLTRKSVKSLETAFEVLEQRAGEKRKVDSAQLNKKIEQLSTRLTQTIDDTQRRISQDLAQAAAKRDVSEISHAIIRAQVRLDEAELTQAEALTRVNKHIADLAKVIDDRMRQQQTQNRQGMSDLTDKVDTHYAQLNLRINKIEDASADALRKLGERVVAVTEDIRGRSDQNASTLHDKVIDIGKNTQHNVDELRKKLERRLESVEEAQKNLDSYADRTIANLTTRLESLEYGLVATAPQAPPAEAEPFGEAVPMAVNAPVVAIDDPFAPTEPPVTMGDNSTEPQTAPVSPVAVPAEAPTLQTTAPSTGPVEYQPEPYVPAAAYTAPDPYTASYADPYTAPANPYAPQTGPQSSQPYEAYPQTVPGMEAGPQEFQAHNPNMIADADLPYDNPAYAEADTHNRPGAVNSAEAKGRFQKPSPQFLRIAALALGVIGLSFVGLKMVGGQDGPSTDPDAAFERTVETTPADSGELQPSLDTAVTTMPAVGEYADNRGATEEVSTATGQSLEEAASNGNAIAQFQLGLNLLEAGQVEDGIGYIRAAANQKQPAAQYRLAKLYETGTGVPADAEMARQLTEHAARNGNRIAMHDLALYFAEGRGGVETDMTTAAGWFEKAAERGVVDSQFNLGVLFESGQGVPRNLNDAFVWYSIAAEQGDQFARERRDILKEQIPAADLAQVQARISGFVPTKIDETANGIFRDLPWAVSENGTLTPAQTRVREVQQLLSDLGYDVGTADGAMGPKTQSAIIRFQKDKNLEETGSVSEALINSLRTAAQT